MTSKNQGRMGRDFMGRYEKEIGCLPKFNYSNGFGWKKHKRHQRKSAFGAYSILRRVSGSTQKQRLGA
jgi:hypothetical protein